MTRDLSTAGLTDCELTRWFLTQPEESIVMEPRRIQVPDEDAEIHYDEQTNTVVIVQGGAVVRRIGGLRRELE